MIDVLIVDDEYLERVLITKSFDWEGNGFRIIGSVSDGVEALALCEKHWPDLVLTDINMPFMDGLELARILKEKHKETEVIIISGFNEFEYAKKGIDIGVRSYILKPLDKNEMAETLLKEKRLIEFSGAEKERHRGLLIRNYFQRLIEGLGDSGYPDEGLDAYSRFFEEELLCVNIYSDDTFHEMAKVHESVYETLAGRYAYYAFEHYQGNLVVLLLTEGKVNAKYEVKEIFSGINRSFDRKLYIAISKEVRGSERITEAYQQTRAVMGVLNVLGVCETAEYGQDGELYLQGDSIFKSYYKDFAFAVKNTVEDRALEVVDAYMTEMRGQSISSPTAAQRIMLDICYSLSGIFSDMGLNFSDVLEGDSIYKLISNAFSLSNTRKFLFRMIHKSLEYIRSTTEPALDDSLAKVVKYVDANFDDPDISLKTVAKEFFMNESYLSRVFKQNMKQSFVEYLNKKRMEKAIMLFKDTNMKIYEIAEAVGINDPNYFGKCFKKYTGVTANQFRAKDKPYNRRS